MTLYAVPRPLPRRSRAPLDSSSSTSAKALLRLIPRDSSTSDLRKDSAPRNRSSTDIASSEISSWRILGMMILNALVLVSIRGFTGSLA